MGDALRQVDREEDPEEPEHDDGAAHERGVPEEPTRRNVPEGVEHDGELEPDEDEEEGVQEVLDDPPDGDPLLTHLGRRQLGRVPAEVDARR